MPAEKDKRVETESRSLRKLQEFMWHAVSRPLTPKFETRKRWTDGSDMNAVAAEYVKPSKSLSSLQRLQIYNQQYWYRVLDCFEDDFPGLRAVLGARRFAKLSREYLTAHPSNSYTLRNLGSELVEFLHHRTDLIEPEVELCLQLARFEWAHVVAFDGEALEPVDQAYLTSFPPDQLRVELQPHASLLELDYALDDYSIALTRHQRDRGEASSGKKARKSSAKAPRPVREKVYMMVHRHENIVYFKRLEAPAFTILSSLARGRSLEEALGDTVAFINERDLDLESLKELQNWTSLWIRLGWLCKPRT